MYTDIVLPDEAPIKMEDTWVTIRHHTSMILPKAVIESGSLALTLNFNSHIKLEGSVKHLYVEDPSISTSKQAEIMYIKDKIFQMIHRPHQSFSDQI
mgnify:CR=1 FL=1